MKIYNRLQNVGSEFQKQPSASEKDMTPVLNLKVGMCKMILGTG